MKKLKLNFDGIKDMLSKEQMKKIKGGYNGSSSSSNGTCTVTVHCGPTVTISCSGSGNNCYHGSEWPLIWVQCDDDGPVYCNDWG